VHRAQPLEIAEGGLGAVRGVKQAGVGEAMGLGVAEMVPEDGDDVGLGQQQGDVFLEPGPLGGFRDRTTPGIGGDFEIGGDLFVGPGVRGEGEGDVQRNGEQAPEIDEPGEVEQIARSRARRGVPDGDFEIDAREGGPGTDEGVGEVQRGQLVLASGLVVAPGLVDASSTRATRVSRFSSESPSAPPELARAAISQMRSCPWYLLTVVSTKSQKKLCRLKKSPLHCSSQGGRPLGEKSSSGPPRTRCLLAMAQSTWACGISQ
jgi:hypothetical protein